MEDNVHMRGKQLHVMLCSALFVNTTVLLSNLPDQYDSKRKRIVEDSTSRSRHRIPLQELTAKRVRRCGSLLSVIVVRPE